MDPTAQRHVPAMALADRGFWAPLPDWCFLFALPCLLFSDLIRGNITGLRGFPHGPPSLLIWASPFSRLLYYRSCHAVRADGSPSTQDRNHLFFFQLALLLLTRSISGLDPYKTLEKVLIPPDISLCFLVFYSCPLSMVPDSFSPPFNRPVFNLGRVSTHHNVFFFRDLQLVLPFPLAFESRLVRSPSFPNVSLLLLLHLSWRRRSLSSLFIFGGCVMPRRSSLDKFSTYLESEDG